MRSTALAAVCPAVVTVVACGMSGEGAVGPGASDGGSEDSPLSATPTSRGSLELTNWRFLASDDLVGAEAPGFDDSAWQQVTVPHTFDGKQSPFVTHSHAWYRTHFQVNPPLASAHLYVEFEGAGTIADVYVNGRQIGEHRGLFTGFVVDASPAAVAGDNVLAVRVDNTDADSADCLPSTPVARRYYEPYGGIYRKVRLLEVDALHLFPDRGSSGVYLVPRVPEGGGGGTLDATAVVRNASSSPVSVHVRHAVQDASGTVVATLQADVALDPAQTTSATTTAPVPAPRRWSPDDPYLYTVVTDLSVNGVVHDSISQRIGFRTFRLTPTGFFVNGVQTPLRGIAKHQESEQHFTAMSDDELRADWLGMQDIGFNLARLVHYPHAHFEYDMADELGIVVWAENGNSTPYPWTATGDAETREMVRQNYNHPSIGFWAVANETVSSGDPATLDAAVRYAQAIHEEDPSRLVTFANTDGNPAPTDPAFDFVGQNLYEGLSRGQPWSFEADAAAAHYVSENGSRATVTQHIDYAEAPTSRIPNVFEPEEFIQPTAEASAEVVFRTRASDVPLFAWWAYRDFQLEGRIHDVCNNGLVTYDGAHRKDHAFLWQAFLQPQRPVVHLVGALYYVRRGAADNGIKAYSNASSLKLTIDGVDRGVQKNGAYQQPNGRTVDNAFYWPVTLFEGPNYVHVDDGAGHADDMVVVFAGSGGLPAPALANQPIVAQVTSSNAGNPAYFVDRPISADVPLYYDFDGTADNSFRDIPAEVMGAGQVATLRMSKAQNLTDLTLLLSGAAKGGDVYIMTTDDGTPLTAWTSAGFVDTNAAGSWHDGNMDVVPFRLLGMHAGPNATVKISGATRDYVVLVRASSS